MMVRLEGPLSSIPTTFLCRHTAELDLRPKAISSAPQKCKQFSCCRRSLWRERNLLSAFNELKIKIMTKQSQSSFTPRFTLCLSFASHRDVQHSTDVHDATTTERKLSHRIHRSAFSLKWLTHFYKNNFLIFRRLCFFCAFLTAKCTQENAERERREREREER